MTFEFFFLRFRMSTHISCLSTSQWNQTKQFLSFIYATNAPQIMNKDHEIAKTILKSWFQLHWCKNANNSISQTKKSKGKWTTKCWKRKVNVFRKWLRRVCKSSRDSIESKHLWGKNVAEFSLGSWWVEFVNDVLVDITF